MITDSSCIDVGDLVYLYSDRNKSQARDRYLVTSADQNWCNVHKFKGDQLRNSSYRVKKTECYKVPEIPFNQHHRDNDSSDDEEVLSDIASGTHTDTPPLNPQLPEPPDIPVAISSPPDVPQNSTVPMEHPRHEQVFTEDSSSDCSARPKRNTSKPTRFNDYVLY